MCEQAKNKEYTKKGKKKSKKLDVKMFLNGELTEGTIVERIGGGKTYKVGKSWIQEIVSYFLYLHNFSKMFLYFKLTKRSSFTFL